MHVHLCSFQITHRLNLRIKIQRTYYTSNHSRYFPRFLAALVMWYTRHKLYITNYSKTLIQLIIFSCSLLLFYSFESFSHQIQSMAFHLSLSHSKPSKVSRTLLSILADFNNTLVWMVSTRHLISNTSSPCTSLLVPVPRAPITIDITVTFIFLSCFNYL